MSKYAIQSALTLSFDEALARAPDALAKEGFGVLLAHRALTSTLLAGVMIPCNVIIWENDDHTSTIAAVDPTQAAAAQAERAIEELARDVRERLLRVFSHIAK